MVNLRGKQVSNQQQCKLQKMSSPLNITDDDDSFDALPNVGREANTVDQTTISVSSDDDVEDQFVISDDSTLSYDSTPTAKKCFPVTEKENVKSNVIRNLFPSKDIPTTSTTIPKVELQGTIMTISGVKINLPIKPYCSQVALMNKMIAAIQKSENCLLESPTGSGKTLALLCAALGWQQQEKHIINMSHIQQCVTDHPVLSRMDGVVDYINTPHKNSEEDLKNFFSKTGSSQRTIYDSPNNNNGNDDHKPLGNKRQEADSNKDSPADSQVNIHKKRRMNDDASGGSSENTSPKMTTPEKAIQCPQADTPEAISLPTIYYGARTHKQLQQVIKEFKRTAYCGMAPMSILSSRNNTCLREYDKHQWPNKNDMCRNCRKPKKPTAEEKVHKNQTNCKYFDNRQALTHKNLPPAFDIEDLVSIGEERVACPYYAAKAMAQNANIVFCPYNYLIDPPIRESLEIDLTNNIVIIDEAHNIEDKCREAATFTITREDILAALQELEKSSEYHFQNKNRMDAITYLIKFLKNWDYWFVNQKALVDNKPVNYNEAVHVWNIENFIDTLNNHNIGQKDYQGYKQSCEMLRLDLQMNPDKLFGITQATGNLVDSINSMLGYLFEYDAKHMMDFTPALIKTVQIASDLPEALLWRASQYNKSIKHESLLLKMMCMNPGVVFESLKSARCIVLASGTLTPLTSLYSELGAQFPHRATPSHFISKDRIWAGVLVADAAGAPLQCDARGAHSAGTARALGAALLRVSRATPHGVLCFVPSYSLLNYLEAQWRETGIWQQLDKLKYLFTESRNIRDHNNMMEEYYRCSVEGKGALLFAVYRGKVSEGMDFKDRQARAVILIGIPYPNTFNVEVKEKMNYNDRNVKKKNLLASRTWLKVQAYRALNQAAGRCVRHRDDWGAVLLVDQRYTTPVNREDLSKWILQNLDKNDYSFGNVMTNLESFMQNMTIRENEDDVI